MILILDGYNVINVGNIALAGELHERRRELVRLAQAYCLRKRGIELLIFFDSKEQVFSGEPANSFVRVIFTENGSADDAIIDWIKRCRKPAEIQVATDDNELRERAKTSGASYISAAELMKRFGSSGPRTPVAIPPGRSVKQESDERKPALSPKAVKEVNQTLPASWFK